VSVSAVVAENSLTRGGALIRVGQVLTITKKGVVRTVNSPVILDPSIVIAAGNSRDAENLNPPSENSQTPAEGESSNTETPSESEGSTETSTETPPQSAEGSSSAPLPALEPIVSQTQTSDVFYAVARGDTLIRIAFRNGTTVSKIVADNAIRNRNRINVGQRLKVGVSETTMTYHRGQEGDTLTRISERRSVPLDRLLSLNSGRTATGAIPVGELVRLS
jgi:LysM repeat protein